ncbi:hypothetical protein ACFC0E_17150, partial [Streptomyces sp. NPDC056190]
PGAAAIKPSHEPATSADTLFRTSHDQNYSCRVSTWANCDIGTDGVGQLFSLVVTATGMATVSTVLWAGMRKATGRRRLLLPLVLTALATAVLLWPMLAVWYVSPGHPESMCEQGGRPVWWPSWLPL